jgi:hypothetical protein
MAREEGRVMADEQQIPIINPWLIVHQPNGKGGSMETILAGPADGSHEKFGLVIADVIRHVANAYGVDEADVLEWVHREMDNPTTEVKRKLQS